MPHDQPWKPADATALINQMARNLRLDLCYTTHAKERMRERDLIVSDLLCVLKGGFVYRDPEPSTVQGLYKYAIEGQSPNSGARYLRVIVVPDEKSCQLKIVTFMWRDED